MDEVAAWRWRGINVMRSFIETAVLIAACGSAVCWFTSAMCHLPSIKPGKDEVDKVTELSNRS